MRAILVALSVLAPSAAAAGALDAPAGAAPQYHFVGCAEPAAPDLSLSDKLKGREYVAAYNERIRAYNVYVEGVNAYVQCLGAEARRDLEAFYSVVNAKLEAEQAMIFARADEVRSRLKAPAAASEVK